MKWTNSYRSFGLKTKRSTGLKTIEHKQTDVKGKKKPDSSRPYLCFLAEHMNVPPADDAVYYLQE